MYTQNFQRRSDLTLSVRLFIAYLMICQPHRGLVPKLCDKYSVSRTFIYNLRKKYISIDENPVSVVEMSAELSKELSVSLLLSLRMEGKCSIESIHTIMTRLGYCCNSVGFISEKLHEVGAQLGKNLESGHVGGLKYVLCCDEIFAKNRPILVSVDPISLQILRIELSEKRESASWEAHWESLLEQGYTPIYIAKDEGTALSAAHEKTFPDAAYQSDTFHAVAHRLGLEYRKLEKSAYNAIETEYNCLYLWEKAQSDECFNKRETKYIAAKKVSDEAIDLFDKFEFLYHCLLSCFQVFDDKGKLKDLSKTTGDFDTALQYLKSLDRVGINKQVKSIEACQKNLFHFMLIAQNIVAQLAQTMDKESVEKFCLAWQTQKNHQKIKGNPARKHALKRKESYLLAEVKGMTGEQYQSTKDSTYALLDQIVQSSAAVEGLNSILRPYLNTAKNNVTQEFLNLFMFYHNHRRFYAGKRKGKTPNELFTGKPQTMDWLELIRQRIAG